MSIILEVADAVVSELNSSPVDTFDYPFVAKRLLYPEFSLEELEELKVSVVPRAMETDPSSRLYVTHEFTVDVGIQKRLGGEIEAEVESMLKLTEEINAYLRWRPLKAKEGLSWAKGKNDPLYVPEHLVNERVFTSVITITYRMLV